MTRQTREHTIQARIRAALADVRDLRLWRVNVGRGWQGAPGKRFREAAADCMVLVNPRPFATGLPDGTPDLIGFIPVVVTADMVGQTIAQVVAVEVKSDVGRLSERQQAAHRVLQECGARVGVARSVDEALEIVGGR